MKLIALFSGFLFLLAIATIGKAQVSVILPMSEVRLEMGITKTIEVIIRNDQPKDDEFSLSVWPPIIPELRIYTYVLPKVDVPAYSEVRVPLIFKVPECTYRRNFLISIAATSTTEPMVKDSESLLLSVFGEGLTCIVELKLEKERINPEEELKVTAVVSNLAETLREVSLVSNVKNLEISLEKEMVINPGETKKVVHVLKIPPKTLAGDYEIEVLLLQDGEKISSRSSSFWVNSVPYLDRVLHSKNYFVLQKDTLVFMNLGNAPTKPREEVLSLPWYMKLFFNPITTPSQVEEIKGSVIFKWVVPSLAPGKEYSIEYEFRWWLLWVVSIALIGFGFFAYTRVYTVKITKKIKPIVALARDKEISISLHITNKSMREIHDIVVKDVIPPLLSVGKRFETLVPIKKVTRAGTELTWMITSLKPWEEVILSYKVAPIVEILGSLKLPPAKVSFIHKGRKKGIVVSKRIVLGS